MLALWPQPSAKGSNSMFLISRYPPIFNHRLIRCPRQKAILDFALNIAGVAYAVRIARNE